MGLLLLGAAGGIVLTLLVLRTMPNPWARGGVIGATFLAPWFAFMPILVRMYPADSSCDVLGCSTVGQDYGLELGVGWCGGMLLVLVGRGLWSLVRVPRRAPKPPPQLRIAELADGEVERVAGVLPLAHRLTAQTYLVAWDGDEPVGHVHVKWKRTQSAGVPDVEDLVATKPGVEQALVDAARKLIYARASK